MRHNNSTMQSKVTINMRRRLSVFVCNSSFSQTWHCRIASFRVQKGIGSIISQRHFDRARDSTLHRCCCCWYYGVHIRKNGSNQSSAHRKCKQILFRISLKRVWHMRCVFILSILNRELSNRTETLAK